MKRYCFNLMLLIKIIWPIVFMPPPLPPWLPMVWQLSLCHPPDVLCTGVTGVTLDDLPISTDNLKVRRRSQHDHSGGILQRYNIHKGGGVPVFIEFSYDWFMDLMKWKQFWKALQTVYLKMYKENLILPLYFFVASFCSAKDARVALVTVTPELSLVILYTVAMVTDINSAPQSNNTPSWK